MFKLIKSQEITNLNATFLEFEHIATKAKHLHLKCDDDNNGFLTVFKTLPYSNNGVMHILEHCVLAGSRDFDMKDPFFSVLKQSLQTFMNAMTDDDNTLYPFSTQNKKDFFNLMHIYTNAVFFPRLEKETFMREGWRYEFEEPENPESKLTLNGIVYNEMLGRLSVPTTRLWKAMGKALYPDTAYANESGGVPINLPELSHEEFKEFHKKYYHPSNAIIITYGNINVEEIHENLEKMALNEFTESQIVETTVVEQTPFTETRNIVMEFPYSEDDYESNNFYLKLFNINSEFNAEEFILADFIKRLIAGDSSSPIIKALEESKLVKDSNCTLYNTINNTSFAISTEGLELKNIAKIDEIIINTLKQIVKDGISKDMIDKELHLVEMANCSMKDNMANKAFYATNMITRFELSNFNKPELYLNPTEGLKILKQQLKNKNAISKFIEEKLLNNTFSTNLTFKATPAKVEEEAKALEKLVADKQASLTESEKQEIIKDSIAFKEFENRDFKGVLPEFSIKDIPSDFTGYRNIETLDYKGTKIYAFKTPTNGISYVNKSTYIQSFDASDLSYLNIYQGLFSLVGYADKTYEQEDDFKFSICDGLNFDIKINEDRYDVEKVYLRADIGSKMLNKNTAVVNNYINEKIAKLRFDEKDRIISQIEKQAMNIKSNFTSYGHELASSLASTKLAPTHNIINKYNGIDSDIFLTKLAKDIKTDDKAYDKLITKMLEIHEKITQAFEKSILLVIDSEDNIENTISDFFDETIISEPNKMAINDNIKTYQPSVLISAETNSNYCVMAINAPYRDHKLSGAYAVLAKIISNDFAHPKFREKGGAYGGFASYNSNNEIFSLLTYMDPALTETFKGFKELAKWLKETEFSNQQLEEGILQVIASFDSPTSVINKCVQATERYLDDIKDHEVKDFRLKVLNATIEQMQEVIDQLILPNLDNAVFTAVANEAQYKQEKLELDTVKFY